MTGQQLLPGHANHVHGLFVPATLEKSKFRQVSAQFWVPNVWRLQAIIHELKVVVDTAEESFHKGMLTLDPCPLAKNFSEVRIFPLFRCAHQT